MVALQGQKIYMHNTAIYTNVIISLPLATFRIRGFHILNLYSSIKLTLIYRVLQFY